VVQVTYRDNPWLDKAILVQVEHLKATDPDEYLWIWEGHCRVALEGAVYAKELRAATREGRICAVPIERSKPVHSFWDLGRGDATAIWFAQIVGFQYRVLGYYQNTGFVFDHYLAHLQHEQERRGWFYGTHWLPHDADNKLLGARRTIRQQAEDAGHRVKVVQKLPVSEGINAARTIFPNCWFDEAETQDGLNCLRAYHYEIGDDGSRSKNPVHDWSSHGADGFRGMGVALKDDAPKPKLKPRAQPKPLGGRHGWMGR
jgi:phage terminase large subunit